MPPAAELERCRAACVELLQARRERDEHECAERLLVRRMVHLWQQLKWERRQQGYAATRARLQVQLVEEDEEDLEADLEAEIAERRLLHALERSGANERLKARDGAAGGAEVGEDEEALREAAEGTFDELGVRDAAAERQASLRRRPGEEVLVPVYTEDTPPTELARVPAHERRRQVETGRMLLYAVLLVDSRVVGESPTADLNTFDFCARFSYSLQLQLLQAPSTIALQIWQRRPLLAGLADTMLSEVYLAIPEVASPAAPRWMHYSFASDKTFRAAKDEPHSASDEAAAGGGAYGGLRVTPLRCLCGQAAVSVAWAAQPAARSAGKGGRGALGGADGPASGVTSFAGSQSRGRSELQSGALDPNRVRQHVSDEELDPNAPQDVPLIALLSRAEKQGGLGGAFRAFRLGRELQLITSWMHRANPERLRLIELRRERPHEWQALPSRAVPTRDTEIPSKMREILQRGQGGALADDDDGDGTRQQSKIRAWARSVMARQQRLQTSNAFMMTTRDVVKEPLLEQEIEAFDCNAVLEKLFTPRRKLRPTPKPRRTEPGSNDVPRKLEIVVVEGVDLPVRAGKDAERTRLFVECSFQGQSFASDAKAGPSPIWNQRAHLDLTAPNGDWSQQSLMSMSADVSFNLFDRISRSVRDERDPNKRTLRDEARWLGSFTVPFSTIYRAGEVKGVFPLSMPPILLGYAKDGRSTSKRLVPNAQLKLFVTVEPLLPPLKSEVRERFTTKDASMQEFAVRRVRQTRLSLPKHLHHRPVTIFAPTAMGDKALVCRYIRPQPPPNPEMLPNDDRRLLRFVSLIPYLDDAALGAHLDVWNTTDSFLDLSAGDAEEHATLLCNFFLALRKEAYVLLGNELPDGETAYVLTKSDNGSAVRLWNAHTGRVYSKDDAGSPLSACPLTSVGCVFNDKNVWANVQLAERPFELSWDLGDPKCWKAFFGPRGFPPPREIESVQMQRLSYKRMAEEFRAELEREVEDTLQREFEDLRGHRPTDWNRSLSNTLKALLRRFEQDASGQAPLTKEEHDVQLDKFRTT